MDKDKLIQKYNITIYEIVKNKLDEFNSNLSVEATLTDDQYERGLAADLQSKFVDGDNHLKFKVSTL